MYKVLYVNGLRLSSHSIKRRCDVMMMMSVDSGDGFSVEIVDEFCYLGDMLSVDGDAHTVVTA